MQSDYFVWVCLTRKICTTVIHPDLQDTVTSQDEIRGELSGFSKFTSTHVFTMQYLIHLDSGNPKAAALKS